LLTQQICQQANLVTPRLAEAACAKALSSLGEKASTIMALPHFIAGLNATVNSIGYFTTSSTTGLLFGMSSM